MNVKSFGCSFIFGTDLADGDYGKNYASVSKSTWPALMAKNLGLDYHCYARPGSGNLQIIERLLNQTANIDKDLYIVGWTWIDRFDYNNRENNHWKTIMPIDTDNLAKIYYRDIHSQYRDKLTTLMSIKLAIDTLKQKDCPFIMTYMDELMFETEWHSSPAISILQDYIRPYMTKFDDMNFVDWSRENGHTISKTMHPLESAHSAAADYMLTIFDKQSINDHLRPS